MGNPASAAHGPALIGTFLNVMLYGIMVTQCVVYYSNYRSDKMWMKFLVFTLLFADTLNSVFDMWWIYDILVNHFADMNALTRGNWIFATDPAMVSIILTMVELFFAWRVKVLTNNWCVVVLIVVTAIGSCCSGISTAIAIHFVPQFSDFQKLRSIVILWSVCTMVCDSAIAISHTWHLRRHRTGFTGTDDILNKIIRRTVQNGLITAIVSIVHLITFLTNSTGLHLVFNFPVAKLYTNCLMSSLISRSSWGYSTPDHHTSKRTRGGTTTAGACKLGFVNMTTANRAEVFVHVESHEMSDTHKSDPEWSATPPVSGSTKQDKAWSTAEP